MSPQDEANLVRFLLDLAQPGRLELHERASARLRGDRPDPSPEAAGRQKRTPEPSSTPRWPVRAWWRRD